MSDDYNDRRDQDYWDDIYYYENYDEELDPNYWSGYSNHSVKTGFWIWLIAFIIASNISVRLGEVVLVIGIVAWIIGKLSK